MAEFKPVGFVGCRSPAPSPAPSLPSWQSPAPLTPQLGGLGQAAPPGWKWHQTPYSLNCKSKNLTVSPGPNTFWETCVSRRCFTATMLPCGISAMRSRYMGMKENRHWDFVWDPICQRFGQKLLCPASLFSCLWIATPAFPTEDVKPNTQMSMKCSDEKQWANLKCLLLLCKILAALPKWLLQK